MNLLGKPPADALYAQLSPQLAGLKRPLHLTILLVGKDPASEAYVGSKRRRCELLGIQCTVKSLPATTTQSQLLSEIAELNVDASIDGVLVQLPLPPSISKQAVFEAIDPAKDVDGFHPENVGRLVQNAQGLVPCTPAGIVCMLDHYRIPIEGKRAVIIGRSEIVGKPVALLLLHRNATVTLCHSKTDDVQAIAREADILIVAIGSPEKVTREFVKPKAVVIDVGIHRVGERIVGDVKPDVSAVASAITPVPGGVGPMTIAMLTKNLLRCRLG